MAKATSTLEWCIVRLGDDHNWWVNETSDPVRNWDVDGLSIIDPRQLSHLIELVDPLRNYGFDQDVMERAFILFRIEKDLGGGKVRLKRTKESLFESEKKLSVLPDVLDEENSPYAGPARSAHTLPRQDAQRSLRLPNPSSPSMRSRTSYAGSAEQPFHRGPRGPFVRRDHRDPRLHARQP